MTLSAPNNPVDARGKASKRAESRSSPHARARREASAGADIQMRSVRRKLTLSAGAKKRRASYSDFNILGDRHCTGNDSVDVRMQGYVFICSFD